MASIIVIYLSGILLTMRFSRVFCLLLAEEGSVSIIFFSIYLLSQRLEAAVLSLD
jgi:hypothetical protein